MRRRRGAAVPHRVGRPRSRGAARRSRPRRGRARRAPAPTRARTGIGRLEPRVAGGGVDRGAQLLEPDVERARAERGLRPTPGAPRPPRALSAGRAGRRRPDPCARRRAARRDVLPELDAEQLRRRGRAAAAPRTRRRSRRTRAPATRGRPRRAGPPPTNRVASSTADARVARARARGAPLAQHRARRSTGAVAAHPGATRRTPRSPRRWTPSEQLPTRARAAQPRQRRSPPAARERRSPIRWAAAVARPLPLPTVSGPPSSRRSSDRFHRNALAGLLGVREQELRQQLTRGRRIRQGEIGEQRPDLLPPGRRIHHAVTGEERKDRATARGPAPEHHPVSTPPPRQGAVRGVTRSVTRPRSTHRGDGPPACRSAAYRTGRGDPMAAPDVDQLRERSAAR